MIRKPDFVDYFVTFFAVVIIPAALVVAVIILKGLQ